MNKIRNYLRELSILNFPFSTPKGFTLIELIVVFSTIAFLSIMGIVSYVSYSQSQSVESEVQKLITTIHLAKSRAASQVKPPVCVGQLDGYSVKIENANQYSLNVVCEGNSYPLKTIALPNNIKFTDDSLSKTVFFSVITGAVSGNGNFAINGYNQDRCITTDSVGITEQTSSLCPTPTPTPIPPTPTPTTLPTPTPTPTITPTPTPTLPPGAKRVFVTSTTYNGNLGGLAGADEKCRVRATAASLGGTWVAWLSTDASHAISRINEARYFLVDNTTVIVNNKSSLASGNLLVPINKDENGAVADSAIRVWTGTDATGQNIFNTMCRTSWNSNSIFGNGRAGCLDRQDSNWTSCGSWSCDEFKRLYCFEQ